MARARTTAIALLALLAAGAPAVPGARGQGLEGPRAAAALEARVLQLEEELRRFNGRVEELEYENRRLQQRLEGVVGAVDQRLSAVEPAPEAPPAAAPSRAPRLAGADDGGGPPAPEPPAEPAAPAAPGGRPVPRRPAPPAPPQRAAAPAPDVEQDASAARGYVLGTIPRDAAAGGPARPPADGPEVAALPPGEVGYEGALDLLQRGRWGEAERAFGAFLEASPDDPRASSAAYWLAETHYFRKDYQTAAATFARNYRGYGADAPKAADNLLKLGMSLAALGDKEKACQAFGELARRHPNASVPVRQTLVRERGTAGCA